MLNEPKERADRPISDTSVGERPRCRTPAKAYDPENFVNILVINHYAGSDRMGMEYRPFYLGREWCQAGHKVTIVAGSWSHLRARQPAPSCDHDIAEEEGVRFRWLRLNSYRGNGVGRMVNMATFVTKLQLYANKIAAEEAPDAVICSSTYPLDIYPGHRIAKKARARLIFEVHDLWPLTPILLGGYSERHPYIRVLQRSEDYAYRTADAVVSILPNACEHMVRRGLCPSKFVHIPNGVPIGRVPVDNLDAVPESVNRLIETERCRGRFLVGFAGSLNFTSTDLATLVEAALLLSGTPVAFLIAGAGPHGSLLRQRASSCGLDNFHLLGHLPKPAIPEFLSHVDVLTVPLHSSPLYRFGISLNKLFDYMMAGRPIIQASDCSNDLVSEANCGLAIAPGSPAAIAEAVLRLRALPERERQQLGENGRNFVMKNHDYRVLARRFLDVMHEKAA
jgi:glycosyltransferase involved in cell wall biosynthesis